MTHPPVLHPRANAVVHLTFTFPYEVDFYHFLIMAENSAIAFSESLHSSSYTKIISLWKYSLFYQQMKPYVHPEAITLLIQVL